MRLLFILVISCATQLCAQIPGSITDTMRCVANAEQQYALYLPSDYVQSKKYALMLFFDPGARATLPIKNYKALADQYHLIMACSYQSRNGPIQPSIEAAYAMLKDITTRFSVRTESIFVSGFSGGARLATLLAIQDTQFAGVIACGATFPNGMQIVKEHKIPYAMVVGDHDMNYLESTQTATYLKQIQNPFTKIEFYGGHSWPPAEEYEQAIAWQLMKNGILENDQLQRTYEKTLTLIKLKIDSGNFVMAHDLANKLATDFRGNAINNKGDSTVKVIFENDLYVKEKKLIEQTLKLEEDWQNKFNSKYESAVFKLDTAFRESDWSSFRLEFNRLRSSEEKYKKIAGERLRDFAWRSCAEHSSQVLNQKDYARALASSKIWAIVTPEDFNPWFRLAKIKALQQSPKESLKFLKKAFEKGFTNKALIENDSTFEIVRKQPAYKKLVAKF